MAGRTHVRSDTGQCLGRAHRAASLRVRALAAIAALLLTSLQTPAQDLAPDAALAAIERQVAAAGGEHFDQLFALRGELNRLWQVPGQVGERALLLSHECFLPWLADAEHGEFAVAFAAGAATEIAQRAMVDGGDVDSAIRRMAALWPHRARGGYRICAMALVLADAQLAHGDYLAAQQALQHVQEVLTSTTWQDWSELHQLLVPILELNFESRSAALELVLGNPDGAMTHVRRATSLLRRPRLPAPERWRQIVDGSWRDATAALQREKVDLYLALELFHQAVATARIATEAAAGSDNPDEPRLAAFYLTLAQSWDPETSAMEMEQVVLNLQQSAEQGPPHMQRLSRMRLCEIALANEGPAAAQQQLSRLLDLPGASSDARITTMQTELLLEEDAREAVPTERLQRQLHAQQRAFEQLLQTWSAVPRSEAGVGFLHYLHRRETIGQLVAVTLRASGASGTAPPRSAIEVALRHVMTAQAQTGLAHQHGVVVPTAAELQALLAPQQAIAVYLPTRSCTHVFVVTHEQLGYQSLPQGAVEIRAEIQTFVSRLQEACGTVSLDAVEASAIATELRTCGARIADVLVPQNLREQWAKCTRLTVIGGELLHGPISGDPDAGLLNYLPLECLPWHAEQLLGQRFAIDHNVSLPVWAQLARRVVPFTENAQLAVFGTLRPVGERDPRAHDSLAGDRMRAMVDPFGPEATTALLDDRCTLAAITDHAARARASKARRIAVFVTHGGYDAGSARGSFLQLHDERLDCQIAQQLGSIEAPFAQLVVLAACQAAKAPTRPGDSLANLGGAFLLAGADAVVQARFDLALHRTQDLVRDLLRGLAAGQGVAEAMRAARAVSKTSDPLDAFRSGVLQVHGCGQ